MTEAARAVAHRMYEAFNSRDLGAAEQIFTSDFHSHARGFSGPANVTRSWQRFVDAYPEARVVVEDMVVERDTVAVRTSVHGTTETEPPTMLELFRVRDGRIAELWGLSSLNG